jgi:hypothetical protein
MLYLAYIISLFSEVHAADHLSVCLSYDKSYICSIDNLLNFSAHMAKKLHRISRRILFNYINQIDIH